MPFILGAGDPTSGYEIENSVFMGSGAGLTKSFSSAGNRRTFTLSTWCKLSKTPQFAYLMGTQTGGSNYCQFGSDNEGSFRILQGDSSIKAATIALFKDPTAWYHVVFAVDTTQSTASNRIKIYVNGILRELCRPENFTTAPDLPNQNLELFHNTTDAFGVGTRGDIDASFDGYMAETFFIDGSQLAASNFGETNDEGIWIPKDCKDDLTFGTNGFYLEYKQTGTSANSSGKGADTSGNDNHFDDNSMGTEHITTDTPTNNFCQFNMLTRPAGSTGLTVTEGGLAINGNSTDAGMKGTFGVSSGKWYWEVKVTMSADGSSGSDKILVATEAVRQITSATDSGSGGIWGIQSRAGSGATINSYTNGTFSNVNSGSAGFDNTDIIGMALDMDNHKLYCSINGTFKDLAGNTGDPANETNPTFSSLPSPGATYGSDGLFMFPYVENRVSYSPSSIANFGQPFYSISSGNSDGAGYGNFEYEPPSGFFSLCTKNLAKYG